MPTADKLDTAELCINLKDHKLYSKDVDDNVFQVVGGVAADDGGFVKLDDGGLQQTIVGGGGLEVQGKGWFIEGDAYPWAGSKKGGITIDEAGEIDLYKKAPDGAPFIKCAQVDVGNGIVSQPVFEVTRDGEVRAQKATINSSKPMPDEGIAVNGDIRLNATAYSLRFLSSDSWDDTPYKLMQLGDNGSLEIRQSGGWGPLYFMSMSAAYISISNDNINGRPNPIAGGKAVCHVYNGLNTQFGTVDEQLGNVAPMNDWSCYPARA